MPETVSQPAVQTEAALRTLSSDIASIAHGATAPVPESVNIISDTGTEDASALQQGAPRKTGRTILMVIILIVIAAVGYFYVYPQLVASLRPQAVIH